MSERLIVDYAPAQSWRQRTEVAAKEEKLCRRAVELALRAAKAGDSPRFDILAKDAQDAKAKAYAAIREDEQVWANTEMTSQIDMSH